MSVLRQNFLYAKLVLCLRGCQSDWGRLYSCVRNEVVNFALCNLGPVATVIRALGCKRDLLYVAI